MKKLPLKTAIVRAANALDLDLSVVRNTRIFVKTTPETAIKFLNLFNQNVENAGKHRFDRTDDSIYFYFP